MECVGLGSRVGEEENWLYKKAVQVKLQKSEKEQKTKIGTMNKGNEKNEKKTVINMIYIDPTI